jgi:hypothetical protein
VLEQQQSLKSRSLGYVLGPRREAYFNRGWLTASGYLTHLMVPFFDDEIEVEVEADVDAGVFRYRSLQVRGRIVEGPLNEIQLYAWQVERWLDELATLIGIAPRHRATRQELVPEHLWHLGEVRVAGTHRFAPVFVARRWTWVPEEAMRAALTDTRWPRGGVVLRLAPAPLNLPGGHVARGLVDFLVPGNDGDEVFDADAFGRVLRGFVTLGDDPEPKQFLRENRLKLPHFPQSIKLSDERARILSLMWGVDGHPPPVQSWSAISKRIDTGYQSFDDAFAEDWPCPRSEVFDRVGYGKYRLRRDP